MPERQTHLQRVVAWFVKKNRFFILFYFIYLALYRTAERASRGGNLQTRTYEKRKSSSCYWWIGYRAQGLIGAPEIKTVRN